MKPHGCVSRKNARSSAPSVLAGAAIDGAGTHDPLYPFSTLDIISPGSTPPPSAFSRSHKRSRSILVGERPHAQAIPHALVAQIGLLNVRSEAGKQRGMLGLDRPSRRRRRPLCDL